VELSVKHSEYMYQVSSEIVSMS